MSQIFEDVVLVVSGAGDNPSWLGTGTLIAPHRILTAAHVVQDEHGQVKPNLGVMFRGTTAPIPASLQWSGGKNPDVAVLSFDGEAQRKPHLPALVALSPNEIPTSTPWEAQGYPRVRDEHASTRLEKVRGQTCSYRKTEARIDLDVATACEVFKGLSGGPVVVNDRIVGVVRAVPQNWEGKRLEATPVGAFLDLPAFREALGLGKLDKDYAERVPKLVDQVARLLSKSDHTITFLANHFSITCAPGEGAQAVASKLVLGQNAMDMAMALNYADSELAEKNAPQEARNALRSVLWFVLPMAIDWKEVVLQGIATFSAKKNALDLPLHKETLAEIVIAGIDNRCCRFAPIANDQMPVGASIVKIPAMAQSALFDRDGSRFTELVVKNLAALIGNVADGAYRNMQEEVEAALHSRAFLAAPRDRLPYYLLFLETDLRGAEYQQELWTLAREKLGQALPTLRLVRLTGGNVTQNRLLVDQIKAIFDRS